MKIDFKTIYKVDIIKKYFKLKYIKPKETRCKFNIGKNITDRPKEVIKRKTIDYCQLYTIISIR